jgi:hypothetical protein
LHGLATCSHLAKTARIEDFEKKANAGDVHRAPAKAGLAVPCGTAEPFFKLNSLNMLSPALRAGALGAP